jgi:hypothetical protein
MALTPRRGAWLIAVGRVVLGAAVLAAPERVTARWLGAENASLPAVGDLARGLAARDIALGLAALYTLDDPLVGPRIQVGCALADGADVLGTVLARRHLPAAGALGTIAVAGAATIAGLAFAHSLAHA